MTKPSKLRIATRGSKLALWQAEHVSDRLRAAHPHVSVELVPIVTTGDRILDHPLAKIGGKGLFIKELQQALLEDRADLAVHSMKDVPIEPVASLAITVIMARADPRDVLVSGGRGPLDGLPPGSRVGTSSLRRKSQLNALRPDLVFDDLRGNVPTRLEQVGNGRFDAVVLAAAGLTRLGLAAHVDQYFAPEVVVPAVGQGAIGIECRADDATANALIRVLNDEDTATCVHAERAMSRKLAGSCEIPLAAHAVLDGEQLTITGLVSSLDGKTILVEHTNGSRDHAERAGTELGTRLLARGAGDVIAAAIAAQQP